MCDSGRKTRVDASPAITCSRIPGALSVAPMASVRFPWVMTQPFGRPVVPEV